MSTTTTTIRVALIGLSARAVTSWAAEGHLTYLLSPIGLKHYSIVALLNSSVDSAMAARDTFSLPSSVKTYGDPEVLAHDPDVDLVVCNTRVDVHFRTIAPSLREGKPVYIEWPLVASLEEALALEALADRKAWNESIVGLQGRVSRPVVKLQDMLRSGTIGKVLSSDAKAYPNLVPRGVVPPGLEFMTDRAVGSNHVTIAFTHMIDYMHEILGEFDGFHSRAQIQDTEIRVLGNAEAGSLKSNVPDFIAIHGALKGKPYLAKDATLAVTWRAGDPFKGDPAFVWNIRGEKGQLQLKSPAGTYLGSHSFWEPITLRFHDFANDEVQEISWDWQDWQKDLHLYTRSIGELYERYAEWYESGKGDIKSGREWPTLEDGMTRMRELDGIFESFDKQHI